MTEYPRLHSLTSEGLNLFRQAMMGELDEAGLDVGNSAYALPVVGTGPFAIEEFETARDMAEAITTALKGQSAQAMADEIGLWAWLAFVLRDQLFPKAGGMRKVGEIHRWYPARAADFQKAQRHLVRMPVIAWETLGDVADHLICRPPRIGTEIRGQLTSQQDMFSPEFQKVCRLLYFDEATGTIRRGAAGKTGPGVTRRLAVVRKQLDVTWDMTDLSAKRIMELLPAEFDAFRRSATELR